MHQRGLGWLILIMLLSVPVELLGQEPGDKVASPYQRAVQELEGIITEADRLTDKLARVKVRAKAASLLWLRDSHRARVMFRKLWEWIEEQ